MLQLAAGRTWLALLILLSAGVFAVGVAVERSTVHQDAHSTISTVPALLAAGLMALCCGAPVLLLVAGSVIAALGWRLLGVPLALAIAVGVVLLVWRHVALPHPHP